MMPSLVCRRFGRMSVLRLVAAAVLGASFLLLEGATARATAFRHATLIRSEPAADSMMPAGLTQFRLVFSEPISPDLSGASLIADSARTIPLVTAGDPRDVHALVAPVPPLDPGPYRLSWRVVSADGHPVKGSFAFRVAGRVAKDTARPKPVGPPSPPPVPASGIPDDAAAGFSIAGAPIVPALLRGFGVGALMAVAGLLAFTSILAPANDDRYRPLAGILAAAAPVLLTAHLIAWLINVAPGRPPDLVGMMTALNTSLGMVELARVGLAWLVLWALVLAHRDRLALGFAIAALIVSGAIGHPAAIAPTVAIPSKVLHLLGSALWLGGLLWLSQADHADPVAFGKSAARVSSVALASIIVVALSGVIQTLLFLPELSDIYRSSYGLGVLAKVAGLGLLVLFGAHHRYRAMPRLAAAADCRRMSHSVRREVVVMAVVVLLGGLLAYIPPPAEGLVGGSTSSLESIR